MIRQFGAGADGLDSAWDLCIVGAGAAGLTVAMQFVNTSRRIIVLESGLREPDAAGDALNTLRSVGLPHDGWQAGRIRSFGGTTRAWGGQLVPLRASELAERAWVPQSGWPLEIEELQPYYRRMERLLRTEGPPYDETVWERLGITSPGFDPAEFCVRFSQWASLGRRNFAVMWRRELERSQNVLVLLDATAVAVTCTSTGEHCNSIEIRSRDARRGSVSARSFVIACGGIETARLLLSSPVEAGGSVANRSGLVGRFFQDHVSYVAGTVVPESRASIQNLFDPRYLGATMYSVKIEPTQDAMRRHGWLNAMGHIAFQIPDALGWMELRRIMRSIQAGRLELPSLDESKAMVRGAAQLTRLILARIFNKRRRSPAAGAILLLIDTEQSPNADSRVMLDSQVDALGMPRALLDWRITDLEYKTLTQFARHLAAEFERLGLGKINLAGPPDFSQRDLPGAARDIFHHMGTTRMSRSAKTGVTRPDLRCHDVDNLFIAGPSVFPAGGIANPTFTALALALRLADHLESGWALH